jgi:hypothetical protein
MRRLTEGSIQLVQAPAVIFYPCHPFPCPVRRSSRFLAIVGGSRRRVAMVDGSRHGGHGDGIFSY